MTKALVLVGVGLFLFTIGACSDDHDHSDQAASCKALVDACHDKDTGSGEIHECHEFGESGKTEAECAAKKSSCLATCGGPAPGDAGGGG